MDTSVTLKPSFQQPSSPDAPCKILIVEDNPDIVANIYAFFEPKGYSLDNAFNGKSGLNLASQNHYDVILLDVMLPGIEGTELCQTLRKKWHLTTPILMLTARDTVSDKVIGFESGADDYLIKPFSLVELEVRIKALVRRHQNKHFDQILKVATLVLNPQTHTVYRDDTLIKLTPIGFKILMTLMQESPNVVSKTDLETRIWGDDIPSSDALRTHLHSLRQRIDKPFATTMINTLAGVGYQIVHPDIK